MTLDEIYNRLKELGQVKLYGTKKEIKELPNVMYQDETLEYVMSGILNGNTWLVTCTNKRILFLDKGLLFGCKQLEIPLDKINSVEITKGLLLGTITVWDGASAMKIDGISKTTLQPFVNAVNNARELLKHKHHNHNIDMEQSINQKQENDYIQELERLAVLKEKGIITEEEFLNKKKQLLGV